MGVEVIRTREEDGTWTYYLVQAFPRLHGESLGDYIRRANVEARKICLLPGECPLIAGLNIEGNIAKELGLAVISCNALMFSFGMERLEGTITGNQKAWLEAIYRIPSIANCGVRITPRPKIG